MRLTAYTMTIGETINTGNYNNVRYEVAGTIALPPDGADREKDIDELRLYLRNKAAEIRKTIKGA